MTVSSVMLMRFNENDVLKLTYSSLAYFNIQAKIHYVTEQERVPYNIISLKPLNHNNLLFIMKQESLGLSLTNKTLF